MTFPDIPAIRAAVTNDDRLKAVRESGLLNLPPSQLLDTLAREASTRLNAPLALLTLLTLVDHYRDFVISHVGLPEPFATSREITLEPSLCQLTVTQAETVIINDTQNEPLFKNFPGVQNAGIRAHLGVPLMLNGVPIGNCCVMDVKPHEWTATDIEILENLADMVMKALENIISSKITTKAS